MMATAGTLLSAAVTVLAVLLGLYTMMLVGRMRGKHGVQAPAVTGAPEFERAFRVQMNTLDQSVLFLPVLWLATVYPVVSGYLAPGLGLVWIVGRVLYSTGYMADAAKRSSGFLIAGVAVLGLLVLSIIGIIHVWLVTRPI
jgi:glutathione S-transferase